MPKGDGFIVAEKKASTPEELKHLLEITDVRERALLAFLATGMRIGEGTSRKIPGVQLREVKGGKYYRLKLKAGEVKLERCAGFL